MSLDTRGLTSAKVEKLYGRRGTHKRLASEMGANEVTQGYLQAIEDDLRIIRTTQAHRMDLILKNIKELKTARRADEKRLMRLEESVSELLAKGNDLDGQS